MRKVAIALALTALMFSSQAHGYGDRGHHLVGAIADRKLKDYPGLSEKIAKLLGGLNLETVAVYPDVIIKPMDHTSADNVFSKRPELTDQPELIQQLTDFWEANQDHPLPKHENRHRMAHYTDVPVKGSLKYQEGADGQTPFDIVHAIPRCIRVLQGKATPEDQERKISPAVAVILLAHYLGDIHQPLHVGAEYFDFDGQPADPATFAGANDDVGGNDIHFKFSPPYHSSSHNLHAFWDDDAVDLAFPSDDDPANADDLAGKEPADWRLPPDSPIESWAEFWANDILPMAGAAHEQCTFQGMTTSPSGEHYYQAQLNGASYPKFAGKTAKTEIHKAGWRLADVLAKALAD
jgi:hypothetical protein